MINKPRRASGAFPLFRGFENEQLAFSRAKSAASRRRRSETLAHRRVARTHRPRHVAQPRQEGQTRVRARHRTRHRRGPGLWLAVHAAHHASRARARGVLVPAPRRRRHGTPRLEHGALHLLAPAQPRTRRALSRARRSPGDTGCSGRPGTAAAAAGKRRDLLFFRRFAAPGAFAGSSSSSSRAFQMLGDLRPSFCRRTNSPRRAVSPPPVPHPPLLSTRDRNASRTRTRA